MVSRSVGEDSGLVSLGVKPDQSGGLTWRRREP